MILLQEITSKFAILFSYGQMTDSIHVWIVPFFWLLNVVKEYFP